MNTTLQEYLVSYRNEIPRSQMSGHAHGLRAGLAAMMKLGIERAKNKELFVRSESGKGHAAGCFLDGIMTATGCTYGELNMGIPGGIPGTQYLILSD